MPTGGQVAEYFKITASLAGSAADSDPPPEVSAVASVPSAFAAVWAAVVYAGFAEEPRHPVSDIAAIPAAINIAAVFFINTFSFSFLL